MALTRPADSDLAGFMNEPEEFLFSDEGYGSQSLDQAMDLMVIAAGSDVPPESALDLRIIKNGICQLAEAIIRTLPERHMAASVISKESAGNYSYSTVRGLILQGIPVGLLWFDLAVDKLQELNHTTPNASISTTVFENEHILVDTNGKKHLLGPLDEGHLRWPRDLDRTVWW